MTRQSTHAEPTILRAFIDRMISTRVLPTPSEGPDGYTVEWQPLLTDDENEKADRIVKLTQAISAYANGAASAFVPVSEYREQILGWDPESPYEMEEIADSRESQKKMPSLDPTKTSALRRRYTQAMNRRFRELAKDIRESFANGALTVNQAAGPGEFDKSTLTQKVEAFKLWLDTQIASVILETAMPLARRIRRHWQEIFIRAAYIRGITDTESALKSVSELSAPVPSIEVAFRSGVHAETLELMNARVFQGLKGITDDMAAKLADIFSRSLIDGVGPKVIAKRITDEISSISRRRAMAMARTETIRVYNESRLNTMEQNQIAGVTADVEFLATDDGRTCSICKGLDGKVFTIKEARGVIPVHVQCRCSWRGVSKEQRSAA
jgi:SPP1 gp7 family putative phage head morphogenesis protein